uniref:Putative single-stranded dna-binding replication protein a rpa medium 30 kd subunit n=1 Tax=Nyssomyia neivai TaxID=330878 RepID=A0A1L8DX65_9DIPT
MNTSFTAGGFTQGGGGGAGTAAPEVKEGFCPLVIKQILKLGDDGIKIFGTTFGVMNLVAIVRSIEPSSTKIMYKLEDHTGRIDAHLWLDESKAETIEPIKLNTYVRAFGIPKTRDGVKVIMLFKIRPIKSANDITTHLLEMMNTRYTCEKNLIMMRSGSNAVSDVDTGMDVDTTNGGMSSSTGLKGKPLIIYQAIKGHKSDEGISIQQIHQKFKHISIQEIRQITDNMSLEGHIYSSIDTDHFLPTE